MSKTQKGILDAQVDDSCKCHQNRTRRFLGRSVVRWTGRMFHADAAGRFHPHEIPQNLIPKHEENKEHIYPMRDRTELRP